jgi:hypothetical protein
MRREDPRGLPNSSVFIAALVGAIECPGGKLGYELRLSQSGQGVVPAAQPATQLMFLHKWEPNDLTVGCPQRPQLARRADISKVPSLEVPDAASRGGCPGRVISYDPVGSHYGRMCTLLCSSLSSQKLCQKHIGWRCCWSAGNPYTGKIMVIILMGPGRSWGNKQCLGRTVSLVALPRMRTNRSQILNQVLWRTWCRKPWINAGAPTFGYLHLPWL